MEPRRYQPRGLRPCRVQGKLRGPSHVTHAPRSACNPLGWPRLSHFTEDEAEIQRAERVFPERSEATRIKVSSRPLQHPFSLKAHMIPFITIPFFCNYNVSVLLIGNTFCASFG